MGFQKLKLGFIGGGINSAVGEVHKIAAQMDGRFELVAGCFSQDSNINNETAEQWGVCKTRIYSNWCELLNSECGKIDAVVILTPTPLHKDAIDTALDMNIPVICEKALVSSSHEASQIVQKVNDTQGFLAVTYNYTGYPMIRELKEMLKNGTIGKIEQVHIEMPQEGFLRVGKNGEPITHQGWRMKDGSIPTLSLDLGVHLHHLVDFLTSEKPVEVVSRTNHYGTHHQVVDNTVCIINYTNNLLCNMWFSKSALGCRNGLKIRMFGDCGSLEWVQLNPENLILNDNKGQTVIIDRSSAQVNVADLKKYNRFKPGHPSGFIEAFANYYYDVADAITSYRGKRDPKSEYVFGADLAYEGLKFLEAVEISAKSRTWSKVVF
ncbi:Gfo/Idh/MocA family protein [Hydrogenovibrio kuenenii]|uniref:Gfo/Idh/MocA family protein n=1 Tax=Hydrogenovibrio kuenenii TaxID=63658 RepID=UPI000463D8A8|nr:Gfo/Idh/MocA family oxidoreductase [Hydrogenovibrio kuenenii]